MEGLTEEVNGVMTETGFTSFSQLLMSDDDANDVNVVDADQQQQSSNCFSFGFSAKSSGSRMLCFGGDHQNDAELMFPEPSVATSGACCSDSNSSVSSCKEKTKKISVCTAEKSPRSNKKRNGSDPDPDPVLSTPGSDPKRGKKTKTEQNPKVVGNSKARKKERLGERITSLQQLVSPYGKADTASVLHEAMGYIKFLHDQVQVLSSAYFQEGGKDGGENTVKEDLRSRGLCLVPLSCTVHVAETNGADFWSYSSSSASASMKRLNG